MTRNPSEVKADIDSGRTHDKVDFPDPAASPLGTDSEAGGTRPGRTEAHSSDRKDLAPTAGSGPSTSGERGRTISGEMKDSLGIGKAATVGAAAVLVVLVIALLLAG